MPPGGSKKKKKKKTADLKDRAERRGAAAVAATSHKSPNSAKDPLRSSFTDSVIYFPSRVISVLCLAIRKKRNG